MITHNTRVDGTKELNRTLEMLLKYRPLLNVEGKEGTLEAETHKTAIDTRIYKTIDLIHANLDPSKKKSAVKKQPVKGGRK